MVDASPAYAIDPAAQLILRRLGAQAALCEQREARLRQLRETKPDDDDELLALATAHGNGAKTVTFLLTSLRATPRSKMRLRAADARTKGAGLSPMGGRAWRVGNPRHHAARRPRSQCRPSVPVSSVSSKNAVFISIGNEAQPLILAPWQRREVLQIYDNPAGTRRHILSVARKNSKTTLCACLTLAHLCGPAARRDAELYSSALSREQAALIFHAAARMVRLIQCLAASSKSVRPQRSFTAKNGTQNTGL